MFVSIVSTKIPFKGTGKEYIGTHIVRKSRSRVPARRYKFAHLHAHTFNLFPITCLLRFCVSFTVA